MVKVGKSVKDQPFKVASVGRKPDRNIMYVDIFPIDDSNPRLLNIPLDKTEKFDDIVTIVNHFVSKKLRQKFQQDDINVEVELLHYIQPEPDDEPRLRHLSGFFPYGRMFDRTLGDMQRKLSPPGNRIYYKIIKKPEPIQESIPGPDPTLKQPSMFEDFLSSMTTFFGRNRGGTKRNKRIRKKKSRKSRVVV
jgi:hypothetical protein